MLFLDFFIAIAIRIHAQIGMDIMSISASENGIQEVSFAIKNLGAEDK
jgi:hypothetical protein